MFDGHEGKSSRWQRIHVTDMWYGMDLVYNKEDMCKYERRRSSYQRMDPRSHVHFLISLDSQPDSSDWHSDWLTDWLTECNVSSRNWTQVDEDEEWTLKEFFRNYLHPFEEFLAYQCAFLNVLEPTLNIIPFSQRIWTIRTPDRRNNKNGVSADPSWHLGRIRQGQGWIEGNDII